jgi:hypothetical protein
VQYVDGTLVTMQADVPRLLHLKKLLLTFGVASGLKVNYAKSNLITINISEDRVPIFTSPLNCQLGNLFFGGFSPNPRKEYFMPLSMFIQRRLPSCSMYLNYGSKLRLVNYVLSSSPIFCISTLKIY